MSVRRLWTAPRAHLPNLKPPRNGSCLVKRFPASGSSIHGSPSTIFAPATPPGKSAIAIVRISGPDAQRVWEGMVQPRQALIRENTKVRPTWPPPARKAMLRAICDPKNRDKIDEGLVLFFPAASSLTAQDMLEFHLHGSTAVMKRVLATLSGIHGLRPAGPGEFTRLAFDNGRMDLTEVEGLRDLIESETEAQRALAVRQAGGKMREAYDAMRTDIISAMSVIEAMIDFGEDESIHLDALEPARQRILLLRDRIARQLETAQRSETIRTGIRLAIFGAPNAGKSSFTNWLTQKEASIVTPLAGTTRDVIELSLDFHGYPVIVSDTAGLRETTDEIEKIGVERARKVIETADLKLCMISLPEVAALMSSSSKFASATLLDPLTASLVDEKTVFVFNKTDLHPFSKEERIAFAHQLGAAQERCLGISLGGSEAGLSDLSDLLLEQIKDRFGTGSSSEDILITRERHRFHLQECLLPLEEFLAMSLTSAGCSEAELDLVEYAESLRYAAEALGKVTGRIQVDEILDQLFSSFCIGK